jgi:23S rRNA (guanosine2251-2'-O)-methyltransferase
MRRKPHDGTRTPSSAGKNTATARDSKNRPPRRDRFEPKQEEKRIERGRSRPPTEQRSANIIYGVGPVLEALRASAQRVEKVIVADGAREHRLSDLVALARENGILVERLGRDRLERVVEPGSNHQGVIAFAAAAEYTDAEEILDSLPETALLVLLDGVEDPRNFGAILRTAECSGVDGIFIPERRAVGMTETVAKSSAGAVEHVKVAKVTNLNRLIDDLKSRGIWVVGTAGEADMNYTEWDWKQPTALVMGSEGGGLHRLVAENCDALVKIPMYGKIGSLNVSVAAGVMLFEARRQRGLVSS